MDKIDSRKLAPVAQAALRKKVVHAVRNGMAKLTAAKTFGVSRASVHTWVDRYDDGGEKSLEPQKRGPKEKKGKLLGWQAAQICNLIRDNHPEQMRLPFALWTAGAVRSLIQRKHDIHFSLSHVQRLLKRWGFSPQKPKSVAYEQDPKEVEHWLETEYPAIKKQAKAEKAYIYWGDEMGARADDQRGRSYSPRGCTPIISATGKRFGCNMVSALSNRGELSFMVFKSRFTTSVFLRFLRRLLKDSSRKVFLIVDGHPVHKSKKVKEWLFENSKHIRLFNLLAYSPDLNPDEFLNNDVKTNAVRSRTPKTQNKMMSNIRNYLNKRKNDPQSVKKYFQAIPVRYAAS